MQVRLQEAQLSQRDRATLRITEYFAKSLKITQGETHHSNRLDALRFTVCSLLSVIILFWSFLGVITCKFLYGHAHFFSLQRRKRDVYNTSYDLRVCLPA